MLLLVGLYLLIEIVQFTLKPHDPVHEELSSLSDLLSLLLQSSNFVFDLSHLCPYLLPLLIDFIDFTGAALKILLHLS